MTYIEPDYWATFSAPLTEHTINQLFSVFTQFFQTRPPRIHLLFQSTGGSVGDGIALYNFFRSAPVPITAYNVGNVASIATISYLGASTRVCSAYGMFMLHRPSNQIRFNARTADLARDSLRLDEDRMSAILADRSNLPDAMWMDHDTDLIISPALALSSGIATEIGEWLPPAGSKIFNIVTH